MASLRIYSTSTVTKDVTQPYSMREDVAFMCVGLVSIACSNGFAKEQ